MLSLAVSLSYLFCFSPLKVITADTIYYVVGTVYILVFNSFHNSLRQMLLFFFQRKKGEEINIQHGQVSCSVSHSRYLMEWDSDTGQTATKTFIFNYALFLLSQHISLQDSVQIYFLSNAFPYHCRVKLPVFPTVGIICNAICFMCVFTRI